MSRSENVLVRRLAVADAMVFRALRLEALAAAPAAFSAGHADELAKPESWFASILSDEAATAVFGAFVEGQPVGMAAFAGYTQEKLRHKGGLWSVYVQAAWQRRGIATSLVGRVIEHAAGKVVILQASVNADNLPARRLYERLGFVEYGREPRALRIGDTDFDDVLLSLDLSTRRP